MIVGFAGAGNMAAAMARGWAGAEGGPDAMLFRDLDEARAEALAAEVDGETRESLPALVADCDVVLLAVKPAALDDVAEEMGHTAPALLSVIAATPTSRLAEAFPGVPLLRVMPNQPVEVRRGVICHPPAVDMPEALETRLVDLLEALGSVYAVSPATSRGRGPRRGSTRRSPCSSSPRRCRGPRRCSAGTRPTRSRMPSPRRAARPRPGSTPSTRGGSTARSRPR
jgi:pyrroline-5-carboxylate reductase